MGVVTGVIYNTDFEENPYKVPGCRLVGVSWSEL